MTKKLLICTNNRANPNNPSCGARGSQLLLDAVKVALANKHIAIDIEASPCLGYCNIGPNARFAPNGAFFHGVSAMKLAKLIKAAKKFTT